MAVLIQYRLDLFGFMNTFDYFGDKSIGGNYGLMDQQEAIKFVYDHAAEMGADQSKISLMGQSGGAMSVGMHLLNPESSKFISIINYYRKLIFTKFLTSLWKSFQNFC
jgi:carboxylesterase type B